MPAARAEAAGIIIAGPPCTAFSPPCPKVIPRYHVDQAFKALSTEMDSILGQGACARMEATAAV